MTAEAQLRCWAGLGNGPPALFSDDALGLKHAWRSGIDPFDGGPCAQFDYGPSGNTLPWFRPKL